MKQTLFAALLASPFISPVFGADIDLTSKVSAVTVFPKGAEISREANGEVSVGEHIIFIKDLPGLVVKNSVRVEGLSGAEIVIGSVDVKRVFVSKENSPAARKKIKEGIRVLSDEANRQAQIVVDANAQRKLIIALASNTIAPQKRGENDLGIEAEQFDKLLDITKNRMASLSKTVDKAVLGQRALHEKIIELQKQLAATSPGQKWTTQVAVNLSAKTAGKVRFKIRYNVRKAGWVPVYDAKLTIGDKGKNSTVKLVRRASVYQSTPDKWDDIALTLSTARPSGRTGAPALSPYILRNRPAYGYAQSKKRKRYNSNRQQERTKADYARPNNAPTLAAPPVPKPVRVRRARVVFAGFLAEYKIAGKVSVANNQSEKNVVIDSNDLPVKLSVHAVPKFDIKAYLAAKFSIKGKSPFLPGQVMLFRDGVFLGKGRLPLLNPGEEHSLSFGNDGFIKIKHSKVTQKTSESGFISKSRVEVRNFVTTIKNLHEFAMPVVIRDRLPYSTHENIEVITTSGSTPPSRKNVRKKRGIWAWDMVLEPNGEKTINFGYQVTWPKEMNITPVR